jgi:hypothetical protein
MKLIFDGVLADRAGVALLLLGPQVLDVVAATKLQRDQVVDDVLGPVLPRDVVGGEDLALRLG